MTDTDRRLRRARLFGWAGLVVSFATAVDPLEGFPCALVGGLLAVYAAWLARNRWLRLLAWGLGLAVVGCAAMLVLTARGGFGGTRGIAPVWGLTAVPYPVGWLMVLVGSVLSVRAMRGEPTSDRL